MKQTNQKTQYLKNEKYFVEWYVSFPRIMGFLVGFEEELFII